MKNNCPLCDGELESLYRAIESTKSGYRYRCAKCNHGFYIEELILKKDEEIKDE